MAPWVISDAGQAGLYPFKKNTVDNRAINRTHSSFRHSDYFYEGNYQNGWLPFLQGGNAQDPVNPMPAPHNWRFYLTMLIVVISIIGLIAVTNGWIHL
ncbi:MAG: hypothetical protein K0S58_2472 [Nitrospira sp.]|jgi:hypothetical protein|nr:hypothetical protein [Nitrospira sp.]